MGSGKGSISKSSQFYSILSFVPGYIQVLTPFEMSSTSAVASSFASVFVPSSVSWIMNLFVICSVFGSLNGCMLCMSRLFYVGTYSLSVFVSVLVRFSSSSSSSSSSPSFHGFLSSYFLVCFIICFLLLHLLLLLLLTRLPFSNLLFPLSISYSTLPPCHRFPSCFLRFPPLPTPFTPSRLTMNRRSGWGDSPYYLFHPRAELHSSPRFARALSDRPRVTTIRRHFLSHEVLLFCHLFDQGNSDSENKRFLAAPAYPLASGVVVYTAL